MTACLLCLEDAEQLLRDLEASKAEVRRLKLANQRLRAKHRRFAEETNRMLTQSTHQEGAAHP